MIQLWTDFHVWEEKIKTWDNEFSVHFVVVAVVQMDPKKVWSIPDYTYCWCLKSIFNIKYFSYEPPHKMRKPLFSSSNCWSFILIGSLLTCTVQSTQINRKTMLCHENYPNNLETNVLWSACFLYILSNFTIHLEIM